MLSLVKEEAKSFSGSNLIFAEEVIEEARHIEVQILGDGQSVSYTHLTLPTKA